MQFILNTFNPWWQKGAAPAELLGKPRQILSSLQQSLQPRQMTMITGLRRVGKTTLIFQLIDGLLRAKTSAPHHILYYSFDEARYGLEQILAYYQANILQADWAAVDRLYVFFDEIQKLADWPEQVKILYDMHPNLKITLSGSANIIMKLKSRESLAGRFFEYAIDPLDFPEYLQFRGVVVDSAREGVFQQTLVREFQMFLRTGGYVEALNFEESQLIKYFKESILERVTYRDIPELFGLSIPDLLWRLLNVVAHRPGLYLDYKNLANDLQFDQRTIMNYVNYLEYSFLMQKLYNFSRNMLSSEKKLKRVYLANSGFTYALSGGLDLSLLMEQFWINHFKAKYFYRSPQQDEVDIIHLAGSAALPIEIKMRENVSLKTARPLLKFMRKFGAKNGLIISDRNETEFASNGMRVRILPYWKYWSIIDWVEHIKSVE